MTVLYKKQFAILLPCIPYSREHECNPTTTRTDLRRTCASFARPSFLPIFSEGLASKSLRCLPYIATTLYKIYDPIYMTYLSSELLVVRVSGVARILDRGGLQ